MGNGADAQPTASPMSSAALTCRRLRLHGWVMIVSIVLSIGVAAISAPALGQTSQTTEAEDKSIGKLRSWSQKYDQALGSISEYARSSESTIACIGICYFSSGFTRHVAWTCSPKTSCNLLCTVNPPAGSCSGGIQVPARR